jgi:hypothetical protein
MPLLFSTRTPTWRSSKLLLDHLLDLILILSEPVMEVHIVFVTENVVEASGVQMPLVIRHS